MLCYVFIDVHSLLLILVTLWSIATHDLRLYQGLPNNGLRAKCGPPSSYYWPTYVSENVIICHMSLYVLSILQALKKCLILISPKHVIIATIEGIAIDIIYVGKLEILTVLAYHCATTL